MLQHAREIAPSVSWEILVRVKRSGGMSVNELAAELRMSYMGVKQHCDDLRKQGYVDTWRRPKGTGRPEKIYRPAPKLDSVLTNWGSELCMGVLAHAAQAYGESAPDRLLYSYLQQKADRWAVKLKGKTLRDRAAELVKFRNADGWMSELAVDEHGIRLLDHHSPLAEVARLYPNVWEMETRALTKILGIPLERTLSGNRSELRLISGEEPGVVAAVVPAASVAAQIEVPMEPEIDEAVTLMQEAPVEEPEPAMEPSFDPVPDDVRFVPDDEDEPVQEAQIEPEPEPEPEPQASPAPVPVAENLEPKAGPTKPRSTSAVSKKGQAVQADLFDF